ncbi:MAG: LysE family translocator [Bacteroidales bacterium]|nr:LysE family translocator [Bacteroidales bacterium]
MGIFHIVTQGILFGLTLSLMIGPAFFKLIQTSISQGFRSGSHLVLGISLSDIIMVFVAWYGLSSVFETRSAQKIISVIGGVVIICFGLYTASKRHISPTPSRSLIKEGNFRLKYLGQGFLFNIVNPGTWLFWLIPIGLANAYAKRIEQLIFLSTVLLTNFCMDIIKCAISNELKKFLTDNVITIINRVVGSILIAFGLYLAISAFLPDNVSLLNSFR